MKISDQGFTERLTTQTGRSSSATGSGSNSQRGAVHSGFSDTLQLSNLAAQLQKASATDSSRSARVSQIAAAVQNGTFQFNSARVSGAIVSEAISGGR